MARSNSPGQIRISVEPRPEDIASLQRAFKDFGENLKNSTLKNALNQGAEIVLQSANRKVPKRTGSLYLSLGKRGYSDKQRDAVGIYVLARRKDGYRGNHAHLIEYGHRKVVRKKKGYGLVDKGFQPAQPFLRPALEDNQKDVFGIVATELAFAAAKFKAKSQSNR